MKGEGENHKGSQDTAKRATANDRSEGMVKVKQQYHLM